MIQRGEKRLKDEDVKMTHNQRHDLLDKCNQVRWQANCLIDAIKGYINVLDVDVVERIEDYQYVDAEMVLEDCWDDIGYEDDRLIEDYKELSEMMHKYMSGKPSQKDIKEPVDITTVEEEIKKIIENRKE